MPVPDITHLQFLILGLLLNGETPGRQLRDELAKQKVKKSGPAFYQLMARLEESGLVVGEYQPKVVNGQTVYERHYKLDSKGMRAWERTRDFYLEQAQRIPQGGFASV